jgi:hypothetical protein
MLDAGSLQEAYQWRWLPEAPGQLPGAPPQLPKGQRPLIDWCALTHRSPLLSKALQAGHALAPCPCLRFIHREPLFNLIITVSVLAFATEH